MSGDTLAVPLAIERLSTAERVAEALREQLLSGLFAPGVPMRDLELSARAGVSRTTMREALAQLAREGLLTHALHRGMEVTRLAPADVRDIYTTRRVLERAGIEALLARPSQGLAALEESVAAMAAAARRQDRRRVVDADVAFHAAVVGALGSRRLLAAHAGAMTELRLALSVTDRAYGDLDAERREHQGLLDLVREGQTGAADALDRHLTRAEAMVCAVLAGTDDEARERT